MPESGKPVWRAFLSGALAQPAYAAPTSTRSYTAQRDTARYVGQQGGTYILAASRRKNYSGC